MQLTHISASNIVYDRLPSIFSEKVSLNLPQRPASDLLSDNKLIMVLRTVNKLQALDIQPMSEYTEATAGEEIYRRVRIKVNITLSLLRVVRSVRKSDCTLQLTRWCKVPDTEVVNHLPHYESQARYTVHELFAPGLFVFCPKRLVLLTVLTEQ